MSGRYAPVPSGGPSSPSSPTNSIRRPSISSIRRPSFSFRRQNSIPILPDPEEMEAAFDGGSDDDEDDQGASGRLLGNGRKRSRAETQQFKIGDDDDEMNEAGGEMDPLSRVVAETAPRDVRDPSVPGSYDFDRDYFPRFAPPPPPSSPPPFQPNSSLFPAQGNSNGIIPTSTPSYPPVTSARIRKIQSVSRALFGSLLPTYFGNPGSGQRSAGVVGGGGTTGVFANLAARPEAGRRAPGPGEVEGPEWVPEDAQKEGPPSYNSALRDAVPPYWETTVVLPSTTSPFGPLTSSASGDEILIDGMSVGNIFTFIWNVLVSVSFQFIGFLLTYVLHTTHAAKHGSRAGLGITLIQYGLYLRTKAEEMIETGKFPTDSEEAAETEQLETEDPSNYWAPGWRTHAHPSPVDGVLIPPFESYQEAEAWLSAHSTPEHNRTMSEVLNLPTAVEVGEANEWLSFILMALGWFLVLTSVGTYWRVKRFERSLRASQNSTNDDPTAELSTSTPTTTFNPRRPFNPAFWVGNARAGAYQLRTWTSEVSRQVGSRWQPFGPPRPSDSSGGVGAGGGDENSGRRGGGNGNDNAAGHEMAFASWSGTAAPRSQFEEDELLGREAYEYPGLQEGLHHGLPRDRFVIDDRDDVD